jgi:hypothetical protein
MPIRKSLYSNYRGKAFLYLTEPDQGEKFIPIAIGEPWSDNISKKPSLKIRGKAFYL